MLLCAAILIFGLLMTTAAQDSGIGVQLDGSGPVIATNFPDSCLAWEKSTEKWYAFSTQSGRINVQMATSTGFLKWNLHKNYDALPSVGSWAILSPHGALWAPDVNQRPDGSWVMYYAAMHRHRHARKHCIGAAISQTIEGPYIPLNTTIVCNLIGGGNIDPNLFLDPLNGAAYLVYKTDGDTIGHGGACGNTKAPIASTPLYMQLLNPEDLTTPVGEPVFLFSNGPEDGPNVERPCMVFLNGTYFMIYNSYCFQDLSYRVKYVSCVGASDVTTCDWPSLKATQSIWRTPLLKTGDTKADLHAPGSVDTDGYRMVFHADVNLEYFERMGKGHGKHVKRDREIFAAELDMGSQEGTLKVKGLYP